MTEEEFKTGSRSDTGGRAFDYMSECDKTCSTVFKPEQVEINDLKHVLTAVAGFADDVNIAKKLLFRGKTRDELDLPSFEGESVADVIQHLMDIGKWAPSDIDILHGAIGVITEAGEVAEYLLRFLNGKAFDKVNVVEEAGDLGWYIVRSLRGVGVTVDQCNRMNIDKLRGRLGDKFDVFRDANRDLMNERDKLEDGFKQAAPETPLFDGVDAVKNPTDLAKGA